MGRCGRHSQAPALEGIIDLGHPLVRLAREIDWGGLDRRFAGVCTPGPGQPGCRRDWGRGCSFSSTCTTVGHNLSGEVPCDRRLENPYCQFFCGELSFGHAPPLDRSSPTRSSLARSALTLLSLSKGAPAAGRGAARVRFRVWITGPVRRGTGPIRRGMKRRTASRRSSPSQKSSTQATTNLMP
jgi:hypothetical protein